MDADFCGRFGCTNRTPPDFQFCSPECTASLAMNPPEVMPNPPLPGRWGTRHEIAALLGVSVMTIHSYATKGMLGETQKNLQGHLIHSLDFIETSFAEKIEKAKAKKVAEAPPLLVPVEISVEAPKTSIIPKEIRDKMLSAAKEAARDVCLRAADYARKQEQHEIRAQLLDDFIHLEEGLQIVFEERKVLSGV